VIVGTLSAPLLALFWLLSGTVLELAVGSELPALALAMALLAVACRAVQYMLDLGRVAFLPVLAAIALVEPVLLSTANDLAAFAVLVVVVQTIAAVSLLALSLRGVPRPATA
jgi:hypothetical protein